MLSRDIRDFVDIKIKHEAWIEDIKKDITVKFKPCKPKNKSRLGSLTEVNTEFFIGDKHGNKPHYIVPVFIEYGGAGCGGDSARAGKPVRFNVTDEEFNQIIGNRPYSVYTGDNVDEFFIELKKFFPEEIAYIIANMNKDVYCDTVILGYY